MRPAKPVSAAMVEQAVRDVLAGRLGSNALGGGAAWHADVLAALYAKGPSDTAAFALYNKNLLSHRRMGGTWAPPGLSEVPVAGGGPAASLPKRPHECASEVRFTREGAPACDLDEEIAARHKVRGRRAPVPAARDEVPAKATWQDKLGRTLDFELCFYAVLGVEKTADTAALKTAFRRLVLVVHPDKYGDDILFAKVKYVYDILANSTTRSVYDFMGPKFFMKDMPKSFVYNAGTGSVVPDPPPADKLSEDSEPDSCDEDSEPDSCDEDMTGQEEEDEEPTSQDQLFSNC
jgi:hypothetical protein